MKIKSLTKKKVLSLSIPSEEEIEYLDDNKSFSELLTFFRASAKLTQAQVAKEVGVRRSTITDWENGQFAPKYRDHVVKLATIFKLSPEETNQLLQAANFHIARPSPTFEPRNPYKGLTAFTQDDHMRFFGRETLIQDLLS